MPCDPRRRSAARSAPTSGAPTRAPATCPPARRGSGRAPAAHARVQAQLVPRRPGRLGALPSPAAARARIRQDRSRPRTRSVQRSDQEERGLHFICLVANLSRQFEFVQNAWIQSTKFAGLSDESDPLLGNRALCQTCRHLDREAGVRRLGRGERPAFCRPCSLAETPARGVFSMPRPACRRAASRACRSSSRCKGGGYFFLPGHPRAPLHRGRALDRADRHADSAGSEPRALANAAAGSCIAGSRARPASRAPPRAVLPARLQPRLPRAAGPA